MGFRRYMARRPIHAATLTGAFTQAYRSDPDAPDAQNWADVRDYLRQRGATDDMMQAARSCWDTYQRSRRRSLVPRS